MNAGTDKSTDDQQADRLFHGAQESQSIFYSDSSAVAHALGLWVHSVLRPDFLQCRCPHGMRQGE